MPNITVDRLALEIFKIRNTIPVIPCMGYGNKITKETALQMGFKALILNPLIKSQLAKTVQEILDDQRKIKQT